MSKESYIWLKRKLTAIITLTSTFVLVVAFFIFVGYEWVSLRLQARQNVSTLAEMLSVNSASPLLLEDADAGSKSLQALMAEPSVAGGAENPSGVVQFAALEKSWSPSALV